MAAAGGGRNATTAGSAMPRLSRHRRTCVRRAGRRHVRADCGGQCRRRHRHDLPRVQGRHRHCFARGASRRRAPTLSAHWCRRTTAHADCCASTACRSGERSALTAVPSPRGAPTDAGSIIVILATDAPLLPIQCQRLARRATTGLAWVGGIGFNSSGDIFLAFATGNHVHHGEAISDVRMLSPDAISPLFQAAAEATEEAILNALTAAETMVGLARPHRTRTAARSAGRCDAEHSPVTLRR